MWEKTPYLSFRVWLISRDMMIATFIHCSQNDKIPQSRRKLSTFPSCFLTHSLWADDQAAPRFGYMRMVSVWLADYSSLHYKARSGLAGPYGSSRVFAFCLFFEEPPYWSPFLFAIDKSHKCPPPFIAICFLDGSHSDWTETESQCSFDLHFDTWRSLIFLMNFLLTRTSFENSQFSLFSNLMTELFVLLALITSTCIIKWNTCRKHKGNAMVSLLLPWQRQLTKENA